MIVTVEEAQQLPLWFFEKCQVVYNPGYNHSTRGSYKEKSIELKGIVALDNDANEYALLFDMHGHKSEMYVPADTKVTINTSYPNGGIIIGEG